MSTITAAVVTYYKTNKIEFKKKKKKQVMKRLYQAKKIL